MIFVSVINLTTTLIINPLVKNSAGLTLEQIINTLQYVGASLDKVADDENEIVYL
jgi:hypothetical protein